MSYIVYHPDTGTIVAAEEAIIINTKHLPECYDDWEYYLGQNEVPWLDVQGMIEDRIGI
jgi:hypothetical protein